MNATRHPSGRSVPGSGRRLAAAIVAGDPTAASAAITDGALDRWRHEEVDADPAGMPGTTPLHVLAETPCRDPVATTGVIGALLAADPDMIRAEDGSGRMPLGIAIESGRVEPVVALLDAGADPERATTGRDDGHALVLAVIRRDGDMLGTLCARGIARGPRQDGPAMAIIAAIGERDIEAVRTLCAHGADPRHAVPDGRSPVGCLADAIAGGLPEPLSWLAVMGATA